jgi:hypothetical protein
VALNQTNKQTNKPTVIIGTIENISEKDILSGFIKPLQTRMNLTLGGGRGSHFVDEESKVLSGSRTALNAPGN